MLKKVLGIIVTLWVCSLVILGSFLVQPAMATPDLAVGSQVFKSNCMGCHIGGRNSIIAAKTLKLDALHEYLLDTPEAIIAQVTNGKNAMPAFGRRLNPDQIESVAAYVLDQAEKDWPRNG
ncbi:MAG: cytochrome c6 PetJ [Cyanophyceae cyanobacterium]